MQYNIQYNNMENDVEWMGFKSTLVQLQQLSCNLCICEYQKFLFYCGLETYGVAYIRSYTSSELEY